MKIVPIIIIFFYHFTALAFPKEVKITRNMQITSSVKIIKGTYAINGFDSLNQCVITIEGNNIMVDFNEAELKGSNNKEWPNDFYGTAIIIKGGKNITLKNANIHGFKVAIMGSDVENLIIQNCNFSYNWRQKLQSGRLKEDVSDWMSYHHNENDEWLRYGAGIYLRNCDKINIHDNIITGGQCGLMMTNCNEGLIYNNNFSFNSGIGIGMYRSCRNKILHNQLDYNVRGYSHGIFNRGQDSADILVFEQSNENTFAYNSATHGGDGFFLWAGQHTMDTGEGGCNDNIIYKNDFSYAPTNGVEVTFSKNYLRDNIIKECDNAIWGGYSFTSDISTNKIEKNTVGIAIEQGQDNEILFNSFKSNKTAIKLWARKFQPSDWGYAKYRDVRSKNYYIVGNRFINNKKAIDITLTDTVTICELPDSINKLLHFDTTVKHLNISACDIAYKRDYFEKFTKVDRQISQLTKQPNDYKSDKHPGRKEIRITQWGPYDYHYPILWLANMDSTGKMFFDIPGPNGKWKIIKYKGVANISATAGSLPSSFTAQKTSNDVEIEAEYNGETFTTQFGEKKPANQPYTFSFKQFEPQITWEVKWYSWDTAHDPNKSYEQFKKIFSGNPIKTGAAIKLDYTWWGEIDKGLPADSFATVATGILQLPGGKYEMGVTADDLVKVFVDGKPVIDFWDAAKYKYDEDAHHSAIINLDGNKHEIRVEHVENAGYATLLFTLKPL